MRERQGGTVGWLYKAARIFENTFRMYSNALNFQIGTILNLFSRYEDYVSLGVGEFSSVKTEILKLCDNLVDMN
jgi:hypothetical protein